MKVRISSAVHAQYLSAYFGRVMVGDTSRVTCVLEECVSSGEEELGPCRLLRRQIHQDRASAVPRLQHVNYGVIHRYSAAKVYSPQ